MSKIIFWFCLFVFNTIVFWGPFFYDEAAEPNSLVLAMMSISAFFLVKSVWTSK